MKKNKKRIILVIIVVLVLMASFHCYSQKNVDQFKDVPENEWFAESVEYVKDNGLMNGVSETSFEPQTSITRGMIVTIIYRLEGSPEIDSELQFSDVNKTYYYCNPIIWASKNGIVNGYSKDTFAPDDEITREQFATILYRYAQKKTIDVSFDAEKVNMSGFSDADKISTYAVDALSWAKEKGLIKGVTETSLEPQGKATRAQAATIFMRFDKLLEETAEDGTSNENDESEKENIQDKPSSNGDSSSGKGNGSNKAPVDNDDKANVGNNGDKNDNDNNAGEWDDVSDGNNKNDNDKDDGNDVDDDTTVTEPSVVIEKISADAGDRVEVKVKIENNPGILGAILNFEFDKKLILVDAVKGEAFSELEMTKPGKYISDCNFVWDGLDKAAEKDGDILTFCFEVSDTASKGEKLSIKGSYLPGDIVDENFEEVELSVINGTITVK